MNTSSTSSHATFLESIFNHVTLPPRLPGKQDNRIEQIERILTDRLQDATRALRDVINDEFHSYLDCILRSLQTCKTIHIAGALNKKALLHELQNIEPNGLLILHVVEQNAGLLIRRQLNAQGDKIVVFECFEASPLSELVLASENALQWDFPGCAVAIAFPEFTTFPFQDHLAAFLEQASAESIKRFAGKTHKAGSLAFESRDTVDPSLISEMLMTILEVNGQRIYPPLLRKRVRDNVCWNDGAEKPWRRCAFWLVLRVAVQRNLTLLLGERGRVYYKFLICLLLAHLLHDSLNQLNPESLHFLKAKLCRRLVKLEVDRDRARSPTVRNTYESLFITLGPSFHKIIQHTTDHIKRVWTSFKRVHQRPIRPLPYRADQRDLYMTLPNSGPYLQEILTKPLHTASRPGNSALDQLPLDYEASAATKHFQSFSNLYTSLTKIESDIECDCGDLPEPMFSFENRCIDLAKNIETYLISAAESNAYDSDPEQRSFMILTIMELWKNMDECATEIFNLLKDYNPGFPPEILDVLLLPQFQDMCRLQKIQIYLKERYRSCNGNRMTIFHDPVKGCFAERYFNSQGSLRLRELQQRIETAAQRARTRKEKEWQELSAEYEGLIKMVSESSCIYTTDNISLMRFHDDKNCTKCFLLRKARRIQIQVHEHPLPSNVVQVKAVLFELGCPRAFSAYRQATWRILGTLARPNHIEVQPPRVLLCDYSGLQVYMDSTTSELTLASTKKSFLMSHYSHCRFPVSLDNVCLPNGLKFEAYFDSRTKSWLARQQKPSFAHLCQMKIPSSSPFSFLQLSPGFAVDSNGPSSYEIMASLTRCPSRLNSHEFLAYQSLFFGKSSRWPSVLVELGSSNLNFSTEATTLLISQLALQAGPMCEIDPLNPLRATHSVFRDGSFCNRLLEQLRYRLENISSNWREAHCLDMLVTLILRLCCLASNPNIISKAVTLLEEARATAHNWTSLLRTEIRMTRDAVFSRNCSVYALWAALICKRTFAVYTEIIGAEALQYFIECSISVQDNLCGNPAALPLHLRNTLVRDCKMVYRMRYILRKSLEANPDSLMAAISTVWPSLPNTSPSRYSSECIFLPQPNKWWIRSTIAATHQTMPQTIYYHLLQGFFLVNGQLLGKLPPKYRKSTVLDQLFGDSSLYAYPSGLPGMTFVLAMPIYGHQIHLGFRDEILVVRALENDAVLELVPPHIFGSSLNFDLPAPLVLQCVHWLNLSTGVLEIRQQPDIWRSKQSNWRLNLNTRLACRRTVTLVDPHSHLFQRIARIFDKFEYSQQLTVYQPAIRPLSVELRRMELSFFVNKKNLLESSQLRLEIDPNQDAGTWYGLNSKLVLRDVNNRRQRIIIVPTGAMSYRRNGFHVAIDVANSGEYGRFSINDVLGRLDCPAEPLLLYLKARYHAYTSFVEPDPLTGRTGTEEALHFLKLGSSQPWTPLKLPFYKIVGEIAKLTPRRLFYPQDLRCMQQVSWDDKLTTTIQDDRFRPLIEIIYRKSAQLSLFAFQKAELPSLEPAGDNHLLTRSCSARSPYQRPLWDSNLQEPAPDLLYDTRGGWKESQCRSNVAEVACLIRDWPSQLPSTTDLAGVLQNWPTIGGYDRTFSPILLSDLLTVQVAFEWGALVNFCRNCGRKDKYRLMFFFAVLSFRNDLDMSLVRTLVAFSFLEDIKVLDPPNWSSYNQFRAFQVPRIDYLLQLIRPCGVPYPGDERGTFQYTLSSKQRRKLELAQTMHEQRTEDDCKHLAQHFLDQWPCTVPSLDGFAKPVLVDIAQALEIIRPEWLRLFQNHQLSQHLHEVQQVLDCCRADRKMELPSANISGQEVLPGRFRGGEFSTLQDLLSKKSPLLPTDIHSDVTDNGETNFNAKIYINTLGTLSNRTLSRKLPSKLAVPSSLGITQELESIIRRFMESSSTVRQQYGHDLMQSLNVLKALRSETNQSDDDMIDMTQLATSIFKARETVNDQLDRICKAFEERDSRAQWLKEGGLWPILTPITLLEQLRSISALRFGPHMKESLIKYAMSITALQRLLRIEYAHQKGNIQRLREELVNKGHVNWQPEQYPDWLLLEIDANILIRPDQVNVALATISPDSGSNSVLQMNMGQGKTSCIMPMVAVILSESKRLVRLVVPKPLLLQTAQMLQARLGGLLGREIRHIPFSRRTPTDSETIKTFYNLHSEILKCAGVMLVLPEHIMSFKLSGLQRLSDERIPKATTMIKLQEWMTRVCRDVLDECDFTLAVRVQLIYPSGSQITVDGHPHRWQTAETLLKMVDGHLWNLQHDFPQSIEIVRRSQGGFPFVFFLRKDAEDALLARLEDEICSGSTAILPIKDWKRADRFTIKMYISEAKIDHAISEHVGKLFADKPHLFQRWNVQFGLNPNRDPIAVPYYAKGVPSEQSEWGHPDVAILFTCLSFYYSGLSLPQMRQSLEHVLKSDDPGSQYDRWCHASESLPGSLREWNAVNVDDEVQLAEINRHVRYNMSVIDYFLNNFVFPKHAKQFKTKLLASGWDIPLFSASNSQSVKDSMEPKSRALTTGFSGTNDNKRMLPLTIKQEDLPGLSHTNAEVLTYLLERRSRKYVLAADAQGKRLSELNFLKMLKENGIRILIDAGAQILEMDNLSLIKAWLHEDYEAPAAVYFDAENKPWVYYRHGGQIPLLASPFVDDLADCLVYLDESHTRGTDLKMPVNARGALTLGLGQEKDKLVQAAMRLRLLKTTQSITFFAPPEVHQSILDSRKKKTHEPIDSCDAIYWLLEQTCDMIESLQPLYFSQGADFCRRTQASLNYPEILVDTDQRIKYVGDLRQKEQQTLKQLYHPRTQSKPTVGSFSPQIAAFMKELDARRKGFQDTGNAVHGSALQEVEQEREVAFEIEAVRKAQNPVHFSPLSFPGLHRDIIGFVNTGRLTAGSIAYEQAFVALRRTALGQKSRISSEATLCKLFVSTEFTRTVSLFRINDNFQRPVNWILWSRLTEAALIIIPEEAEILIPLIRNAKTPTVHLITYAAPVTRKMLHFNDLKYYALPDLPKEWKAPTWFSIALGIFAGRLYYEWDEYGPLCKYLGVEETVGKLAELVDDAVAPDGITDGADDAELVGPALQQTKSFTNKPLAFMHEWLDIRRKGLDFAHTPMGYMCHGKPLSKNHPFFSKAEKTNAPKPQAGHSGYERGNGRTADVSSIGEEDVEIDGAALYDGDFGYDEEESEGFNERKLWLEEEDVVSEEHFLMELNTRVRSNSINVL